MPAVAGLEAVPARPRWRSRAALLEWLGAAADRYLVLDQPPVEANQEDSDAGRRSLRVVAFLAVASVGVFAASLVPAGVPVDRWPSYLAAVGVAAITISVALMAVRPGSWASLIAAGLDSVVIASLGALIGEHYHQVGLLYALVTAAHAVIHGFRAAFVMVALGAVLVPFVISGGARINPADPVFAFTYLLGIAGIIWIRKRLVDRTVRAVAASEAKYRALVESVPTVVYVAGFGPSGEWRYINAHIESLLGFAAEEWMADADLWWRQIHPDDRAMVLAEEEATWNIPPGERDIVEYRMFARDGSVRWIRDEATVVRGPTGEPDAWHGFLIDVTERRNLEDQLKYQAFHDPLTGLPNRVLFTDRVANALARAVRGSRSPAVLFLDIDDFKTVNDGIGHSAGDALLRDVAERLLKTLRPGDTAARLGGDEFGILLEDLVDRETAVTVADRILEGLAKPFDIEDREILASASIGIAHPTTRLEGAEELLRNADVAMYDAKRLGKGRHETYVPAMHLAALRRLETVEEIRQGLRLGEFTVHYQPIVRLSDGSVIGFEALARWNHPRLGLVLPSAFIPSAEDSGQILEIGEFVLGEACRQAVTWRGAARDQLGPTVSVNVSARQFRADSLCRAVEAGLAASGLAPERLTLEITESAVMDDSEVSSLRLRELKDLGVRLAIDDFGTGYSSLSSLRRLPIDILKVDKSFIDEISEGGVAFGLARDIVRIGRTLHLEVVAEGVESASQVEALRRIGCGFAQGFHFARPMDPDEIAESFLPSQRAARRGVAARSSRASSPAT